MWSPLDSWDCNLEAEKTKNQELVNSWGSKRQWPEVVLESLVPVMSLKPGGGHQETSLSLWEARREMMPQGQSPASVGAYDKGKMLLCFPQYFKAYPKYAQCSVFYSCVIVCLCEDWADLGQLGVVSSLRSVLL